MNNLKRGDQIKYIVYSVWVLLVSVSLYFYFFAPDVIEDKIYSLFGSSILLGYFVYLLASCLRGFTLIPITYFIVLGILLLPPLPLYIMTMIGAIVSSACVYYFSEYLNFDQYFEDKHPKQIHQIKNFLVKNELPIVIGWSFAPFLPTDLICYVCGAMEIDIKKFLFGVFVGEGISCAIYIFLGKEIIGYFF